MCRSHRDRVRGGTVGDMDTRMQVARLTVGAVLSMIVGVLLAVVSIRSAIRSWRGGVS